MATASAGRSIDAGEVLKALRAIKRGDFSVRMPLDLTGVEGEVANAFNDVAELNQRLVNQLAQLNKTVGQEGKVNYRAQMGDVGGDWLRGITSVNEMVGDLVRPTTEVVRVIGSVARGDLAQVMPLEIDGTPLKGEFLKTAKTINTMTEQLRSFASEVTRVAREVGTEGKLGGQAEVKGLSGTWKDLTDNVNSMAGNLTSQVRNIALVTTAVANGDLSKKITVDVRGEILELKNTINTMVDQLGSFASEVTRVAREVGTEGKLGGQAKVRGVAGTWKDLTDSVNSMASNLTSQVRNIAEVTTAVAKGDLSKKITVNVEGEILELKNTINVMVDQLSSFASEVTRVAKEVGTEGNLGGQAEVRGVSGTWKDLTENVNFMASNLTSQVRNIADVTTAVAKGDLSKKITVDVKGEILELKNTINVMVDQLSSFASEVTRVAREVGTEGKLGGQAYVKGVSGTWKDLTDNVNSMAGNLTDQVRNIALVTTAVANGDLSKKITVDVKGEILALKNTINTMVDQLSSFASEVTRVAREVGTEGNLGGQAQVRGVGGIWADLTQSVNYMAGNLTLQVRGIAAVVTSVANGDLDRKLVLTAKGEIAALVDTINEMTDTLATFSAQVTTVAREVGVEGKLGGQAKVPGAAGTWRDLTDNVNLLAANLTTQVRSIAEVSTAVTKGDLTRSITVEASGEVAALKDNINEMIFNLKHTTQKNTEQDWLKTNLTKFTRMLQGQRDLLTVANLILSEVSPLVNAQHGVFYILEDEDEHPMLKLVGSYAYQSRKNLSDRFALGEGLVGQCAIERQRILLQNVPENYVRISSGLGDCTPLNIVVLPILFEGEVRAVIELASMQEFTDTYLSLLDQLTESIGIVLNTIEANMRTENLLKQSQSLAHELQTQQDELTMSNRRLEKQTADLRESEILLTQQQEKLRQTNQELQEKAELLALQNKEVEQSNREIDRARRSVEEKARQLALTSKYKSEFLANMSHELRTPLNSLLILSKLLAENEESNLNEEQVEFAETIYSAGTDLLALINDILDLSKIESGNMTVDPLDVSIKGLKDEFERNFRHVAEDRHLSFAISVDPTLPQTVFTDGKRLNQILKNLLSNAFKFTENGSVELEIKANAERPEYIDFAVRDTGIGISSDKLSIVFEAFQQADGTTSRKYGGTGLGLAISRELAALLKGQITVTSTPDVGSCFTLTIPYSYTDAPAVQVVQALAPTEPVTDATGEYVRPINIGEEYVEDDRLDLLPGERTLLIIEDDPRFARLLRHLARAHNLKVLITDLGEEGIYLARRYRPLAITLDLHLTDGLSWTILDQLKHHPVTRNIPVHLITVDAEERRAFHLGAESFLHKPVSKEILDEALQKVSARKQNEHYHVLLADGDEQTLITLQTLLRKNDFSVITARSASDALQLLHSDPKIDCLLTGMRLPDMEGVQFIDRMKAVKRLPVLVFRPIDATDQEVAQGNALTVAKAIDAVVTLEQVCSTLIESMAKGEYDEKLLSDYASPSLSVEALSPAPAPTLTEPGEIAPKIDNMSQFIDTSEMEVPDIDLKGRTVLIVDDDKRNIMALRSVLKRHGLSVLEATDGREGIEMLMTHPEIECILMDIMMPNMDGYEAMTQIRKNEKYLTLPIIALTAKAMLGDKQRCLQAGASDYIAKPIEQKRLIDLLKIWISNPLKTDA